MSQIATVFQGLASNAPALAQTTAAERVAKLQKLMKAVLDARPALNAAAYAEMKSSEIGVIGQIMMLKAEVEFISKHLHEWMQKERVKSSLLMLGKKAYIKYEPKGVVLNLSTWNAPIVIGLLPAIGAIASGNAVALKPSELAPESAKVLAQLVKSVFPENEFAVFVGGPEIAQELLAQPFNHIYYTGGQRVGRIVMRAAAENFASVTLEMGGKNPVILGATTDIPDAALKIGWGRVANAGQICVAPDYALVHASREAEFVSELGKALTSMYNPDGKGFDHCTEYPRIITPEHFARVRGLVEDAVAKGAVISYGGEMNAADKFIAPIILTKVTDDMKILHEEIFGPVLPVATFDKPEDAVRRIASRPKALALYIYSRDKAEIEYFLNHTSSGSTVVNNNVIQSGTNPHLPFGGVNHSGMGRVGGRQSFLEFSNPRSLVEDPVYFSGDRTTFPPHPEKFQNMMRSMLTRNIIMPNFVVVAIENLIRFRALFGGGGQKS